MKLIRAIVKPEKAIILKDQLQEAGYHGISSKEIKGYGEAKQAIKLQYRSAVFEQRDDAVSRTELDLVVSDDNLADVINAIKNTGTTGEGGDGRIYTIPLDDAIHIESGTQHVGNVKEKEIQDI